MATWREELAWCAGFFDGEGHIGTGIRPVKSNPKWIGRPLNLTLSQTDRFVLDHKWRACRECRKMATAAFEAAHPEALRERWRRSNAKRAAKRKLAAALLEAT